MHTCSFSNQTRSNRTENLFAVRIPATMSITEITERIERPLSGLVLDLISPRKKRLQNTYIPYMSLF